MTFALQDEIRRSAEARYDHRLHGVLLVAQGMTCRQVAAALGDAPRTVEYWVHRFEARGFAGLSDGLREGRPSRLKPKDRGRIETFGNPPAHGCESRRVAASQPVDERSRVEWLRASQPDQRESAGTGVRANLGCG